MKKPDSLTISDEAMLLLEFSSNKIVINTQDNHYKFWTYSTDKNILTTYWGRIGKTVQRKNKEMNSEYYAKSEGFDSLRWK